MTQSFEIAAVDNAYADATDCPICPLLATDRDDALNEAAGLRAEVGALRLALVEMYRFVQVEFEAAPYDHEVWEYVTDPEAIEVARGLQEMADNGGRWEE